MLLSQPLTLRLGLLCEIYETSFSLFVYMKKTNRFCLHIYFLFSVQHTAAVYPLMSNHQCLYPHIPLSGSYNKPVAVCFMTALKLYLASQYIFTVQADQQVCTALQNPTFSLSVTFSIFLCQMHSSLYLCLSQFLSYCCSLSLSHSLSLTYHEASDVCADVLSWLLSPFALAAFALSLTVLLFSWLPFSRVRCRGKPLF